MAEKSTEKPAKKSSKLPIIIIFVVIILVAAFIALQIMANRIAEQKLRTFIANAHIPYAVSWSKVSYKLWKMQLEVKDLQVDAAKAELVTVPTIKMGSPLPQLVVINVNNFSIPVTENFFGRYTSLISGMGYSSITGSSQISAALNGKTLDMKITNLVINNAGKAEINLSIGDVSETSADLLFRSLPDKPLLIAWGSFDDTGLTNNIVNKFASDTNTPADKAKARVLNGINRRMTTQFKTESEQKNSLAQLYRFVDSPNKITIQVLKQEGMTLRNIIPPANITGWRNMATWYINIPQKITVN